MRKLILAVAVLSFCSGCASRKAEWIPDEKELKACKNCSSLSKEDGSGKSSKNP